MTEKEYIARLEAVFAEINTLTEDVKAIKGEAKAEGYKATKLAKIAKLRAEAKVGTFMQEVRDLINTIEQNDL